MKNRHDSDARSILASTRAEWAQRTHGRKVEIVRRELERTRVELGASNVTKERGGHVFARFVPSKSELIAYRERAPLRAGECVLVDLPALALRRADRIWIAGPNGAGKTTLMRALMTNLRVPADEVLMIPQELSVADIRAALDTIRALAPDARGRVLSIIAALGSDPGRLLVSESLSPGEARKLLLALGLGRLVAAVLLDEPTNHLDLPCIERLEAVLQSYPGALVLSSHDEALARRCTSVRWALGGADIEVESTAG